MKEIRFEIDEQLHREFKAKTALEGKNIRIVMIELLTGYTRAGILPKERIIKFRKE